MEPSRTADLDFAVDIDFSQILTNPILDIAARFWEPERYEAFKTCYRSMRIIDDLVDERKATGKPVKKWEARQYAKSMRQLLVRLRERRPADEYQTQLLDTIDRFKLPFWPWERLVKAMIFDLEHDGFDTFLTFLRYTEGAAIAPASIFTHLCGIRPKNGGYAPPPYDIRKAARSLALFSYLVHIMRDFQKDQQANLNYFAGDLMEKSGADLPSLRKAADKSVITTQVRSLFREYHRLADYYRLRARQKLDQIQPLLRPRYQLSLEIIYSLYEQIFDRVDCKKGCFSGRELNPTPAEVKEQIKLTVDSFSPRA